MVLAEFEVHGNKAPAAPPPLIRQMRCGRNNYCSLKLTSILTATGTGSLFL